MKKILKTVFTEEEKKEYQEIELEMLKNGYTGEEIAEHIGVATNTVSRWKQILIAQNRITQPEINEARQTRKKKAEEKELGAIEQFIIDRYFEGKSIREMASKGPYGRALLASNIKRMEEEGKLPKETGKELREKRRRDKEKSAKEKKAESSNKEIDDTLIAEILKALRDGLSTRAIIRRLKITAKILDEVKKQLIEESAITKGEIKVAQEKKKAEDEKQVLEMLLQGAYPKEIESEIECTEAEYIVILNRLKAEKGMTDVKINKAREDRKQRELNELMKFVAEERGKGLTQKEIATVYRQKYGKPISIQTIIDCEGKIKAEGIMTEEIEVAQRERKKAKTKERRIESERTMGRQDFGII